MTRTGRRQVAAVPGRAPALLLTLAGLAGPTHATAACVEARERPLQAIEAVRVVAHGFPRALAPAVERAMAMWNAPSCNSGGFPFFRGDTEAPHRVLHVRWVRGTSPQVEGSCGSFLGNQIVLYSQARDPLGGAVRPCGNVEQVAQTLAHELGHALGLADQYDAECSGYIMGQLVRLRSGQLRERQVRPEECRAADRWFLTIAERGAWADADRLAGSPEATAAAPVRSPAGAAGSPRRSARIALGIPATESDGYRP